MSTAFLLRSTNSEDFTYFGRLNFLTDTYGDEHGELSSGFDEDTRFYIDSWDPNDGVIAFDHHQIPAGGLWWCWGTPGHHGRGFVDKQTPELALAVEQRFGGKGVAKQLFAACFEQLRARGTKAVSLCVSHENTKARSLYEKLGFELVRNDVDYAVMRRDL
ncbi:GNAT family N-acetyltransferase [Corynebacterium gerontici]|uniref:Putative acetyltransferase n=1 Tax=Corynebacterium gerontici TaxID=2079234 RepID=A0A3G6J2S1_9CORY|nr:N-acetyltransferase [Corynebacterium gerontici]AZA11268.1 putative acetyltransferase [Corynebacterium gerontici]